MSKMVHPLAFGFSQLFNSLHILQTVFLYLINSHHCWYFWFTNSCYFVRNNSTYSHIPQTIVHISQIVLNIIEKAQLTSQLIRVSHNYSVGKLAKTGLVCSSNLHGILSDCLPEPPDGIGRRVLDPPNRKRER